MVRPVFSGFALLVAGALAVGTSVPASAFSGGAQTIAYTTASGEVQSFVVADDALSQDAGRATYTVTEKKIAPVIVYGARGGRYTPTSGSVRWPFPYATTITDGFGPRVSPCAGCSSFHKGIDFTPGEGAQVFTVAAGTVVSSVVSNAGLGNEVIISHTIDGVAIESLYGHLEMNSSPLRAGQKVAVGQLVGRVGATGTTTGSNMHLEIHVNGVPVDPFGWLTKNAR